MRKLNNCGPVLFLACLVAFAPRPVLGNVRGDLASSISQAMASAETETALTVPAELLAADPAQALTELAPFQADTTDVTRHLAYGLVARVGRLTRDPQIRQEVTARLLVGASDSSPLVSQHAQAELLAFSEADFSLRSKDLILDLLRGKAPGPRLIRLAGVAGLRNALPRLKELTVEQPDAAQGGKWYGRAGWAARLARARLGLLDDLRTVIQTVEQEQDPIIRVTILLRDLVFTQKPPALLVVRRHLNENETLPRAKESSPGTSYAQYAMDALAEGLPDFPVDRKYIGGYSTEEIRNARRWLEERFNQERNR